MTLRREQFADFFQAVHKGHSPFRWQERLLDHLLASGRWPDQIVAPTGAGKTAVIDIHIFAVALMAVRQAPKVPRRLALVVGRRNLVDDQYEHAKAVAELLASDCHGVLGDVAEALRALRWQGAPAGGGGRQPSPLVTARLRGALPVPRRWLDDPTACGVLCCTPEMWGSRLLLRGYGASSAARPREAGLLTLDSVVVVDEAHLAQQLLTTAKSVARLASVAGSRLPVPALQVVETTATPTDPRNPTSAARSAVGVEFADFETDSALADRMLRPKTVRSLPMPAWPVPAKGAGRKAAIRLLADEAGALRDRHGPTVGCFVNTVDLAVRLTEELRTRGLVVELFCGRLRPYDVDQVRQRRPGLLSLAGNHEVDVIVATQTLEVGVDIDLSAALSELAPGAALAQRAGRVNRIGRRESGEVVVAVPEAELTDSDPCRPYQAADLNAALGWVNDHAADPAGLAPWALRTAPPPRQSPRRLLYQRVELADSWHWARTGDDIAAEPDLDLWLADDFEPDHDVGVVVRVGMPEDPQDAVELVRALPPRLHEVFPTSIGEARRALTTLADRPDDQPAMVRLRAGDVAVVDPTDLRPGDVVIIDEQCKIFRAGIVRADPEAIECADDVLEARPEPGPGEVVLRVGASARITDDGGPVTAFLKEVADLLAEDPPTRAIRAQIGELLNHLAGQLAGSPLGMLPAAVGLLRPGARVTDCDVLLQRRASDGSPLRLLIIDTRRAASDEEVRQSWSTSNRVPLSQHSAAVADRAAALASTLGLGEDLVEVLRLAGLHHDAGKVDPRFQRMLGADADAAEPLAKSGMTSVSQIRAAYAACGLPPGWRHEQLSVVSCWPQLAGLPADQRQLVARLVGTSHGRGRQEFPHSADELLATGSPTARDLFDEGGWDQLIEQTHWQWGVWGCAYLEAVLRAADGQVSTEGS